MSYSRPGTRLHTQYSLSQDSEMDEAAETDMQHTLNDHQGEEGPAADPQAGPASNANAAGSQDTAVAAAADISDDEQEVVDASDDEDEDEGDEGGWIDADDDEAEDDEDDDEYEQEEEPGDDEEEEEPFLQHGVLRLLFGRSGRGMSRRVPAGLQRLPVPIFPLQGDLAAQINADTSSLDVGQYNAIWPCLDHGFDSSHVPVVTTEKLRRLLHEQQQQQLPASKRLRTNHCGRQDTSAAAPAGAVDAAGGAAAGSTAAGGGLASEGRRDSLERLLHSAAASLGAGRLTRSASRRAAAEAGAAGDSSTTAAAEAAAGPSSSQGAGSSAAAAAAEGGGSGSSINRRSSSEVGEFTTGFTLVSSAQLVLKRELSIGWQQGFSRRQQRHLGCHRNFPLHPQTVRDSFHSRAYIGQYSASGDFFIAAFQDRRVKLYDTQLDWKVRKNVTTRMTRWTITDTCLSPDQRLLVYASISPVAFVVTVGNPGDLVDSMANITELHEPLALDGSMASGANNDPSRGRGAFADSDDEYEWRGRDFGIWSIAWSPQGGQLIAGTNDNSVYVYDIESKRCLSRLTGHDNDVNAVAYLDGDGGSGSSGNPHVLVSGSDDHMVRVWDIRDKVGRNLRQPQGVLVGHTEGLTHVCPKGDGVHLISNAKDQTVKLWDVRKALSASAAIEAARQRPQIAHWDYRWEDYPADGYNVVHPADVSLMTYRGHAVLQTLIRAYFSPAHTTGQRYIYSGSAAGVINAWDVVSGKPVAKFEYHRALVRDCSWHPYEPEFTSVSWDGRVVSWGAAPPGRPLTGDRGDVGRYY